MMYAAEVDAEGTVIQIIVGDPQWAETNLGGKWLPADDENYPGIGWLWNGMNFLPQLASYEEVTDDSPEEV